MVIAFAAQYEGRLWRNCGGSDAIAHGCYALGAVLQRNMARGLHWV